MGTASSLDNMQVRLILHVGVHKTGTTALQKFLYDNQSRLSSIGFHRVQAGMQHGARGTWGQHELAWALRKGDEKGLWEEAKEEIPSGYSGVISSEEFSHFQNAALYSPVVRLFPERSVRPICYLRRQDQFLESVYNHHVKSLGEFGPIMQFAQKIEHRLNYAKIVGCLAKAFGNESIALRTYDQRFLKGDIFEDFMSALGVSNINGWARPQRPVNPGLTEEGLRVMLQANQRYADRPRALADARRDILTKFSAPSFREHQILSPDERHKIIEKYRDKNNEIAELYLDRRTMF